MSVSIVEILGGDKGLDLQNGYWARQPTILGNWNTIRIGARIHVPVTSTVASNIGFLRFGLCSGLTNVPGRVADGSVENSLCWRNPSSSWSYDTDGLVQASSTGTGQYQKIETGSATLGSATGTTTLYLGAISSAPAVMRVPVIMTITKGSPNWSIVMVKRTSGAATNIDISLATLYAAMESATPDSVLGTGYAETGGIASIAMDEGTHGTLDTVFVTWAQSSPPIYVSEVLVARLA